MRHLATPSPAILLTSTKWSSSVPAWVRSEQSDEFVASGKQRDALRAEIGDIGICLLLLCARANIDLSTTVIDKVKANAIKYPVSSSVGAQTHRVTNRLDSVRTGGVQQVDTERQLLYVACTSARDQLLVASVEPASEFVDDLQA